MNSSYPKIHIILPIHNRIEKTKEFIYCTLLQKYKNYHLYLIDDGSTDGTTDFVKSKIKNMSLIKGNGHLWWSGALRKAYFHLMNKKIRVDDIVWIANDDILFDKHHFESIVADQQLNSNTLVISPGISLFSKSIEYGFQIDWPRLRFHHKTNNYNPDALTTRGLYMYFNTYKQIGPTRPKYLPHYLSDLEYTIRAKKKGFNLIISNTTKIFVDRSTTGNHVDNSKNFKEFLYNNLLSKKSAYNYLYTANFILLTCPFPFKVINILRLFLRFLIKFYKFNKARLLLCISN